MKTFHIKAARAGAPSAAVVGYEYDSANQRTRTVYLGSVLVDANPEQPEQALRLQAGKTLRGAPFEATDEHLALVRNWLEAHGTYRRRQREAEQALERERLARLEAEDRLKERIEAQLRTALEQQWRDEFEARAAGRQADPLQAAVDALAAAREFVQTEAARLRQSGVRLARVRTTRLEVGRNASALDQLQARANRLRLAAFDAFATGCKQAGLMGAQQRRRTRSAK